MAIQHDLGAVLENVGILSPGLIRFGSEPPVPVIAAPVALPGFPAHPLPADPLVRTLQVVLYNRCYMQRLGETAPAPFQDLQMMNRLAAANRSQDRWDAGWRIYQLGANGQIHILKGERQRAAVAGEYIALSPPGVAPQVGTMVILRVVRDAPTLQPGFFFMFGETPSDVWDDYRLIRFYFHCRPEVVTELVSYLTIALNRFQIPYQMKALSDAATYIRTDSMVLYCAHRYFHIVARILQHLPQPAAEALKAPVPLFTKRIRAGVGLAEDPRTGESFGMHRCRLTAEGMVDAWNQGRTAPEDRWQAVAARFARNGFDLERPYLNPGSVDRFELAGMEEAAA
ncbi:MAG TPA: T3SS effector HopA1 family protein [Thermoanaerobaculia bacterium]|nr:T3SS effector HopA1 family protein [Thermoanaerobaculia bacterium]